MDKWLGSLSVSQTPQVRIPLNVLSFFFFPLTTSYTCNLLAWTDICAAEIATWGVGPDVFMEIYIGGVIVLGVSAFFSCLLWALQS